MDYRLILNGEIFQIKRFLHFIVFQILCQFPLQFTLSIHSVNSLCQFTLSIHSVYWLCQFTTFSFLTHSPESQFPSPNFQVKRNFRVFSCFLLWIRNSLYKALAKGTINFFVDNSLGYFFYNAMKQYFSFSLNTYF